MTRLGTQFDRGRDRPFLTLPKSEHGDGSAQQPQVLAMLMRHGWNSTSFQVLEPGLQYWRGGEDSCVAYLDTGRAWVVAGAPIASESDLARISADFCEAARRYGRRVVFFGVERRFLAQVSGRAIRIGEQPSYDPSEWRATVQATPSLRKQLNRARNKGVQVRRLIPAEIERPTALRQQIEALIARWLRAKPLPAMGFLVRVAPFSFLKERRTFIAHQRGQVVAFCSVVPIYARNGGFIKDLIRDPNAPNGTLELLVDAAMQDAAATGKDTMTLGLAPLAGAVEDWLSYARWAGSSLFDFAGLSAFKAKFRPRHWVPVYLAFPPGRSSVLAIYDSLAAFAHGKLVRFGLQALLRGPGIVVRLMATLLIPWMAFLAVVDGERWFGSPFVKWFWIGFDSLLVVGLFAISRGQRPRLASLVLAMVVFDALVTVAQALLIDVGQVRTFAEALLIGIGVVAPILAGVILANFRARLPQ